MSRPGVPCDDDWMSLVLRGGEGTPELEAFREHLGVCDDCWGTWLAWRCLESEGAVQPGDEQIIARSADRALRALRREQPRARRTTAAAAAAVLLTAVAASAGVVAYQRRAERQAGIVRSTGDSGARRAGVRPGAPVRSMTIAELPPESGGGAPRPTSPRRGERSATAAAARRSPATVAAVDPGPWDPARPSATALFVEATDARREGRLTAAIEIFRRLQLQFPKTQEATISFVSLAELLANGSAPADALTLFDAYLTSAPAGVLYLEALVGKARVLERLGRMDEARAIRRDIGRRPSGSLYVPTERR